MANEFAAARRLESMMQSAHIESADELKKASDATDALDDAQTKLMQTLQRLTGPMDALIQRNKLLAQAQSQVQSASQTQMQQAVQSQAAQRVAAFQNSPVYQQAEAMQAARKRMEAAFPASTIPSRLRQAVVGSMLGGSDRNDSNQNGQGGQPQDDPITSRMKSFMKVYRATTLLQAAPGRVGEFAKNLPNGMFSRTGASYEEALEKLPPGAANGLVAIAVLAAAAKKAYDLGVKMEKAAIASSELTQRFSDLHRQVGGSSLDAARASGLSRYTGVDAGGAARSFNERITSDPFAMGLAAQMGISNTPGIYGKRNFGQQYQQAIEKTAAIRDRDTRERTAEALGIGQEVNRYRLAGPEQQRRMNETARITARVNNPEAERKAAQLQAAVANEAQARENMQNAMGQFFGGGATKFLNWFADQENGLADWMTRTNSFYDQFRIGADKTYGSRADAALKAIDAQSVSGGSGGMPDGMTAQAANTQATINLTAAFLKYADKVYGGGERAANATPSGLRGANLHRALQSGALHLGYL